MRKIMNPDEWNHYDTGGDARLNRAMRRVRGVRRDANPWSRLVLGATILAFGLIFWLDQIGRLNARDYLPWWPLILIAGGLSLLTRRRWIAATVDIVIGVIFLPSLPFLPHFRLGEILDLWPLLITAAGVTLIAQALRPVAKDARGAASFRAFAFMGGSGRSIGSSHFVGGDAVVVMGACEINLMAASINGEALIDVLAFWGGIEIRVPRGWRIENRVTEMLGAFANNTTPPVSDDAPRLVIRGSTIMSGIEVTNPREGS
jgi:hypothetical protein